MIETPQQLKQDFLLDRDVIFLNHGSFGATPTPVFDKYQEWQRRLEHQPVLLLGRQIDGLLREAMEPLAHMLHANMDDVVFVPNSTAGINIVARSLKLQPDDEVLATDHEYGACLYAWEAACAKTGAKVVQQAMPLPFTTADAFVERFWEGVTPKTRVIFISHITSPTGLIFPIAPILERARAAGIITVVDGAHAPGHVPIHLEALAPDFYTGNFHKWLCAPKGSAFLYARPEHQAGIEPLIVSWGWTETSFALRQERQGTRDYAAYLATPQALYYQFNRKWPMVRARCHAMIVEVRDRIDALTGCEPIAPAEWLGQMAAVRLPKCDVIEVKTWLYDDYGIEVPVYAWQEQPFIRVSVQGYNTAAELDALLDALRKVLSL